MERKPVEVCQVCYQTRDKGTKHDCHLGTDTPETTSGSGVKSDQHQNPDINHVSSTGGDLDGE